MRDIRIKVRHYFKIDQKKTRETSIPARGLNAHMLDEHLRRGERGLLIDQMT